MEGRLDKAILDAICKLESSLSNIEIDLTPVIDILTQILNEPDFELKWSPPIKFCIDGDIYTTFICQKFEDNVLVDSSTLIINPNGTLGTTLPNGAEPCEKEEICNPWLGGGTGDNLPAEEITDLTLILPECNCSGTLVTSIGTIPFSNMLELCAPSVECPYSITEIQIDNEATCTLNNIKWLASRKK